MREYNTCTTINKSLMRYKTVHGGLQNRRVQRYLYNITIITKREILHVYEIAQFGLWDFSELLCFYKSKIHFSSESR